MIGRKIESYGGVEEIDEIDEIELRMLMVGNKNLSSTRKLKYRPSSKSQIWQMARK